MLYLLFWDEHVHASEDNTLQVGPDKFYGARLEARTVVNI